MKRFYSLLIFLSIAITTYSQNTAFNVDSYVKISSTSGNFKGSLTTKDYFGVAVAPLQDFDGDGVPELLVGEQLDDEAATDAGAAWLLYMNADGTVKKDVKITKGKNGFSVSLKQDDQFGVGVSNLGDLDNNGTDDMGIGAYFDDDGSLDESGALYINFTDTTGYITSTVKISANATGFSGYLGKGDGFGFAHTVLGDINADGTIEIAVSAPLDDDSKTDAGAVYIISLDTKGAIKKVQKISATAGNFKGTLDGNDNFGYSLTTLSDINGDGINELIVGAHLDDDGSSSGSDYGCLWILFLDKDGKVTSHQKISNTNGNLGFTLDDGDKFGRSVSYLGDVDDDNIPEIIVGGLNDDDGGANRGALYILSLKSDGTVKCSNKVSDNQGKFNGKLDNNDRFGVSMAAIADYNNDGLPELLIGAKEDDDGGTDRGAVYFITLEKLLHKNSVKDTTICAYKELTITTEIAPYMNWYDSQKKLVSTDSFYSTYLTPNDSVFYIERGDLAKGCSYWDTVKVHLANNQKVDMDDLFMCGTNLVKIGPIKAPSGYSYTWTPGFYLTQNNVQNPYAKLSGNAKFNVTIKDGSGCEWNQSQSVEISSSTTCKGNCGSAKNFQKTFGGSKDDQGVSIIENADSSYYILGSTQSYGAGKIDFFLTKMNKLGILEWYKTYGGTGDDEPTYLYKARNGDLIMIGSTKSYGGSDQDAYVIRVDLDGKVITTKVLGGTDVDIAYGITELPDNTIVLQTHSKSFTSSSGSVDFNIYVLSSDLASIISQRRIGQSPNEGIANLIRTVDNQLIGFGNTAGSSSGDLDGCMLIYNKTGEPQSLVQAGGGSDDRFFSGTSTSFDQIAAFGSCTSYGNGGKDFYFVKFDKSGNVLHTKALGGSKDDIATTGIETRDGGFLLAGSTLSFGGTNPKILLVKTDSTGRPQWSHLYGDTGVHYIGSKTNSIIQTLDGGYAFIGYKTVSGIQKAFFVKTDANGNTTFCNNEATRVNASTVSQSSSILKFNTASISTSTASGYSTNTVSGLKTTETCRERCVNFKVDSLCNKGNVLFTNLSSASLSTFKWEIVDTATAKTYIKTTKNVSMLLPEGKYYVTLFASDTLTDTIHYSKIIEIKALNYTKSNDTTICNGDTTLQLKVTTMQVKWKKNPSISDVNSFTPIVKPKTNTTYFFRVIDTTTGCKNLDSVKVNVQNSISYTITKNYTKCPADTVSFALNTTSSFFYAWSPNYKLINITAKNPMSYTDATMQYFVKVYDNVGCFALDTVTVIVKSSPKIDPPLLRCVSYDGKSLLKLSWDTVKNDPNFLNYSIYRSNSGNPYQKIRKLKPFAQMQWQDSAATSADSLPYHYTIKIENTCHEFGSYSDTITSTVLHRKKVNQKRVAMHWNDCYINNPKYTVWIDSGSGYMKMDSTRLNKAGIRSCNLKGNFMVSHRDSVTGCESYSNPVSFSVKDTISPVAPSIVNLSVLSHSQNVLTLKKSPSTDASGFKIRRAIGAGSYSLIGSMPVSAGVVYNDRKLQTDVNTYSYKVYVRDTCGLESGKSTAFTHFQLTPTSDNLAAKLSWTGFTGYSLAAVQIEKWDGSQWVLEKSIGTSATSYTDPGLNCNVPYYYRLKGIQSTGSYITYSDSVEVIPFDTISPKIPVIRSLSYVDDQHLAVRFAKITDADLERFQVYVSKSGGGYALTDSVKKSSVAVYRKKINVPDSVSQYCVRVTSLDSCAENESQPAKKHCTMLASTKLIGCTKSITVSWSAYTYWGSTTYTVWKSTNGGSYSKITSALSTTSYTDASVSPYNDYCYKILAISSAGTGDSSWSNTTCNQIYSPKPLRMFAASVVKTDPTNGEIEIKWQSSDTIPHLSYYKLYSRIADIGSFTLLKNNISPKDTTYIYSGINTKTQNYEFYIRMVDSCGFEFPADTTHRTMDFVFNRGQLEHNLSWTAYQGFTPKFYIIQQLIGSTIINYDTVSAKNTFYNRYPAPCNLNLYYRIAAESFDGQIAISDTAGNVAIDTIPANAPRFDNVSVDNDSRFDIHFTGADSADMFAHVVIRKRGGGIFKQVSSFLKYNSPSEKIQLYDNINTQNNNFAYVIVALDSCLNATPSDTFYPIQLRGEERNLENQVHWNPFIGYSISKYKLLEYNDLSANWDTLAELKSTDTSYLHTGLSCNVGHAYRIVGFEKGGSRRTFSDTIRLTPFDTINPSAPSLHFISVLNDGTIDLDWNPSDKDVKTYEIWQKTTGSWRKTGTTLDKTTYSQTGLYTKDSTYSFKILAIDSCSTLNRSFFGKPHIQTQLTGAPSNLANDLSWSVYQGFNPIQEQYVQTFDGAAWNTIATLNASTSMYNHNGLSCNTPVTYRILTFDGSYYSASDTISITPFDTINPNAPIIQAASIQLDGSVVLNWTNSSSDVKFYDVYRSSGGKFSLLTTVTDTFYNDKSVDGNDSAYTYYLIAIDSCNTSNRSFKSKTHTVINTKIESGACRPELRIAFTPYVGLVSGVDEYEVWRSEIPAAFSKIAGLSASSTSFIDTLVKENTKYCYRLLAKNNTTGITAFGDSICLEPFKYPAPDSANISLVSIAKTGITDGAAILQWNRYNPADTFARGYSIYELDKSGNRNLIHSENDLNKTDFVHTKINTTDSSHRYQINIFNLCSVEGPSSKVHQPIQLVADNKNLETQLSWNAYSGRNIKSYTLVRHDQSAGKTKTLTSIASGPLSYIDSTTQCGHQYYYVVKGNAGTITTLSDSAAVITYDSIAPPKPISTLISVTKTDEVNGEISLNFIGNMEKNRSSYEIFRSSEDGNYSLIYEEFDVSSKTIQLKLSGLNTSDAENRLLIVAKDSCGNYSDSSVLNSPVLLKVAVGNKTNALTWSPYRFWNSIEYQVQRKKGNDAWITRIILNENADSFFDDQNIRCDSQYTYRIVTIDKIGGLQSYSNEVVVKGLDNDIPDAPFLQAISYNNLSATAVSLQFAWKHKNAAEVEKYEILASDDSTNFKSFDFSPTEGFDKSYGRLDFDKKFYQIVAFDSCGNVSAASRIHAPIILSTTAGEESALLEWTAYYGTPVKNYLVYRDEIFVDTLSPTQLTYTDVDLLCTELHEYQIKAILYLGGTNFIASSNNAVIMANDQTKPEPPYMKWASVDENNEKLELAWAPSSSFDGNTYELTALDKNLNVLKKTQSIAFGDTSLTLPFLDESGSCFYLTQEDYCGNFSSVGNLGCVMELSAIAADGKEIKGNQLSWPAYRQWENGVGSYRIYRNADGFGYELIDEVQGDTTYEDFFTTLDPSSSTSCYRIEAIENNGHKAAAFSTSACVQQKAFIHIPNAFSPNADGINESFGPYGLFIKNFEMMVFARTGARVFETTTGEYWDGKFNKNPLELGVYLYILKVTGNDGTVEEFQGYVTIVKNDL